MESLRRDIGAAIGHARSNARSILYDVYAFALSAITIAIGLGMLHQARLVTSGVAGMALLVSYGVPMTSYELFGLINIPFFIIAWFMIGPLFVLRSACVTGSIVVAGLCVSQSVIFSYASPIASAIIGGSMIGLGVLFAARHSTGVGGTAILSICLNRRFGWNMGIQGLCIDTAIVLVAIPILGVKVASFSAISAISVNLVLYAWHVPKRI